MKKLAIYCFAALSILGCQHDELVEYDQLHSIKANLEIAPSDTKVSISEEGKLTWSEGDKIRIYTTSSSVEATLIEGEGTAKGNFSYNLNEDELISDKALYPYELYYEGSDIVLPSTYNLHENTSNANAAMWGIVDNKAIEFKHLAGIIAFDLRYVPADVTSLELSLGDNKINGTFSVADGCITAEKTEKDTEKTTTLLFSNPETAVRNLKLFVPVPVGTYNNMNVTLKNSNGEIVKTVTGHSSNTISRKTMLRMPAISFDFSGVKATFNVVPFFSDAKVKWTATDDETISGYAIYVDNAEPIIITDKATESYQIGDGNFDLESEHTVSMAYIDNKGEIIQTTKSDPVTFKTAKIYQATRNVGPTHVCAAWDDVSGATKNEKRLFYVELFASNDIESEPLYSLYTYDGQFTNNAGHQSSSWYGKVEGANVFSEPRMTFGNLEPGKDYYFRVRTIDPIKPQDTGMQFCTASTKSTISSSNGASAFSKLFTLRTESERSSESNEVLFQGFDQLVLNADLINAAATAGPMVGYVGSKANTRANIGQYYTYPWQGKYSCFVPNTAPTFAEYQLVGSDGVMTEKAGPDLEGWAVSETKVYPKAGYIRIGNAQADVIPGIITPPLENNLTEDEVICDVTFDACPTGTDIVGTKFGRKIRVDYLVPVSNGEYRVVVGKDIDLGFPRTFTDASNYLYDYQWKHCTTQVKLAKGYKIRVVKAGGPTSTARICLDNIKISVAADQTKYNGNEDNIYTEETSDADGTDYDVYDLNGDFPISYWYSVPNAFRSFERYQELKDCGFNIINYSTSGEDLRDVASNQQVISWAKDLNMKFFASLGFDENNPTVSSEYILEQLPKIVTDEYKETFVGYHFADEPNTMRMEPLSIGAAEFDKAYPDKVSYINLYPAYARTGDQLYADSYEAYVDRYFELFNPRSVSFDAYPISKDRTMRQDYYWNLDIIRYKTLERNIPFWYIGHGGGINAGSEEIGETEFRWNAWSAFALGSKGYQYFCYWTPIPEANCNIDPGFMIDLNGNKTKYYDYAQRLNEDIVAFGKKLLPCHADGLIQASDYIYEVYQQRFNYGPLTRVEGDNAIVGCFINANTGEYLLLVTGQRTDFVDSTVPSVTLKFDSSVTEVDLLYSADSSTSTKIIEDGTLSLTIPHGEAYIVELNVTKNN